MVAHDAEEALVLAREKKPDLITVDLIMPGLERITGKAGPLEAETGLALVEILKHDPETRQARP